LFKTTSVVDKMGEDCRGRKSSTRKADKSDAKKKSGN